MASPSRRPIPRTQLSYPMPAQIPLIPTRGKVQLSAAPAPVNDRLEINGSSVY